MEILIVILCVLCVINSAALGVLAVSNAKLWIEHVGLKNSTHTLQYIDPKQAFQKPTKEELKDMGDDGFGDLT